MKRISGLLQIRDYYLRFLKGIPKRYLLTIQFLGILSSLLNAFGITTIIPFFAIFLVGKDTFISKYVTPHFGLLPPFLIRHFVAIMGFSIIAAFALKAFILMVFLGTVSNASEEYTSLIRNRVNLHYIHSLGSALDRTKKSEVIYLNSQLPQFSSFDSALVDINLKFYLFLTILTTLGLLSLKITIAALALVGIILTTGLPLYRWTRKTADRFFEAQQGFQTQLLSFLEGAEIVRCLNVVGDQLENFDVLNRQVVEAARTLSYSRQAVFSLPELLVVSLSVGGTLLLRPGQGEIIFVGTYGYALLKLIAALSDITARYNGALELLKVPNEIYNYLSSARLPSEGGSIKVLDKIKSIQFQDVRVLSGTKEILKGASADIPIGKKVQILGHNGSGKTSLIRCLLGLAPYEGSVLINGLEISEIRSDSLYDRLSYHSQQQFLFNDTILNNLLVGNRDASAEEAMYLCRKLGFDRFINRLSKTYDTVISESATNLSGGEKQSLCLVRTLLRKSDVVIIDEFANHLDSQSVASMIEYLRGVPQTLIMVTHKPVDFCDLTLVVRDGRLNRLP